MAIGSSTACPHSYLSESVRGDKSESEHIHPFLLKPRSCQPALVFVPPCRCDSSASVTFFSLRPSLLLPASPGCPVIRIAMKAARGHGIRAGHTRIPEKHNLCREMDFLYCDELWICRLCSIANRLNLILLIVLT